MNIDTTKSIEQLENKFWGEPEYNSSLVISCHNLRKKPLQDFEIKDLRIMIGQNIGLDYLIPLSILKLEEDILVEGGLYEGDLLTNVLSCDRSYWTKNTNDFKTICRLFNINRVKLKAYDISEEIKQEWFDLFRKFRKMK